MTRLVFATHLSLNASYVTAYEDRITLLAPTELLFGCNRLLSSQICYDQP